jgi:HPt (histidine-containing phosphotransfer) domain-containing protein
MEAHDSQPIDRAFLARFTLDSAALEQEILELFASQMPLYVEQLRTAANTKDWRQAAHGIKGSALAVGAHRLASLALAAERLEVEAWQTNGEALRRQSVDGVAAAAEEACRYIACLFATA